MVTNNLAFRRKLARTFPGIYLVPVGLQPAVVISQAEYCQEVLVRTQDFDKPLSMTRLGRPVFGNGILTAENEDNREQRRLVQPVFKHQNVAMYAQTITEYAERLISSWSEGETIDVTKEMTKLTMQIIGAVMFSMENLGDADQLGRDIHTALRSVASSFLFPIPFRDLLPSGRRTKEAIARVNEAIYGMIADRRTNRVDQGDLLDLLLQTRDESGIGFTDEQVRDEVMTIFIAGHETVALALSWTLYRLACHPGIQRRAQREVDAVLNGHTPRLDDLSHLPFILQVFKESLRFYPPGHVIIRMAVRDTTLGGYRVPSGAIVLLDAYAMHHRPDYFPHPAKFDPERFTPQNENSIPRFAYLPFGTGPRVCIGRHFAVMEANLILSILVQHIHFERAFTYPIKPHAELTLRPGTPITEVIRFRDKRRLLGTSGPSAG